MIGLVPGTDRPAGLDDDERQAYERLGPASWWGWANRGRWDPVRSWEAEG